MRWVGAVGALLAVWCGVGPSRAEDPRPAKTEAQRRQEASDRLIEMSIVLGRLQRLKAQLAEGADVSLGDVASAMGTTEGPQERLIAEKQALEMLAARLQELRRRKQVEDEEEEHEQKPSQQPEPPANPELTVEAALQRMGPPSLPESSRALGDLLRQSGYYGLALDAYGRIPKRQRTAWDRFNAAVCHERLGELRRARALYRQVYLEAGDTPLGEHARWVSNVYLPMIESK